VKKYHTQEHCHLSTMNTRTHVWQIDQALPALILAVVNCTVW